MRFTTTGIVQRFRVYVVPREQWHCTYFGRQQRGVADEIENIDAIVLSAGINGNDAIDDNNLMKGYGTLRFDR